MKKLGHWMGGWVEGMMVEPGKGLLIAIKNKPQKLGGQNSL